MKGGGTAEDFLVGSNTTKGSDCNLQVGGFWRPL